MNDQELLGIVYVNTDLFSCNTATNCAYKERTVSYALGVNIPQPPPSPDEIFKECCYTHFVLADLNSSEDFRNDYSAFYHQRQLSNETCDFILYDYQDGSETILNNDTYGQYFGFGYFDSNVNLKGYKVQWRKVLQDRGEGGYSIIKRQTIAGVTIDTPSIAYTLRQFTTRQADHTTRIDIVMNGSLIKDGVDFTGTGWKHSIRVPAFFGRREPKFVEDNIVGRDYNKRQVSSIQSNEYKFQTNKIPECVTSDIIDFVLFANDIYINDYNLNNHSYKYVKFPVKFNNNEGTVYTNKSRNAQLNFVFEDRLADSIKRNY